MNNFQYDKDKFMILVDNINNDLVIKLNLKIDEA